MRNIALVGFMGTGKTTIAQELARELKYEYVDIDEVIEETEDMKIVDIFAQKGEKYFRNIEKEIVRDISAQAGKVIACGGGIVLDEENIQNLKASGVVICLEARPEVILERTKNYLHRPLLNVEDKKGKIRELLQKRKAAYARADWAMDTSDYTQEEVIEKILYQLKGWE